MVETFAGRTSLGDVFGGIWHQVEDKVNLIGDASIYKRTDDPEAISHSHEGAYDAFATGSIMLYYLEQLHKTPSDGIVDMINKLHLMRSDLGYIDLSISFSSLHCML